MTLLVPPYGLLKSEESEDNCSGGVKPCRSAGGGGEEGRQGDVVRDISGEGGDGGGGGTISESHGLGDVEVEGDIGRGDRRVGGRRRLLGSLLGATLQTYADPLHTIPSTPSHWLHKKSVDLCSPYMSRQILSLSRGRVPRRYIAEHPTLLA